MTESTSPGIVREFDIDARLVLALGLEMDDPGVFYHRSRFGLPGQAVVGFVHGGDRIPFDRDAHRPPYLPMRATLAPISHLNDVRHEFREVFVVAPHAEDLVWASVHRDCLLKL